MKLKIKKRAIKSLSNNSRIQQEHTPNVAGAGYWTRAACSLKCDANSRNCGDSYGCKSIGPDCKTITCL